MGKSELTKSIEKALLVYKPTKLDGFEINYRRQRYIDYEGPVQHAHIEKGLIDCVWLVEGYNNHTFEPHCMAPFYLKRSQSLGRKRLCETAFDELRQRSIEDVCDCDEKCFYCRPHKNKDEAVAIICFEIKVSQSDFKSTHGHNFIGNLNYYVMPYNLYKQVESLIPENIGVITYHYNEDNIIGKLRHTKPCTYNEEINYPLYTSLLHTFLNKKDKRFVKVIKKLDTYNYKIVQHYSDKCNKLLESLSFNSRNNKDVPKCFEQSEFSRFCIKSCYNEDKPRCRSCIHSVNYFRFNVQCNLESKFEDIILDVKVGASI